MTPRALTLTLTLSLTLPNLHLLGALPPKVTRSFDAARIVTMACIAAIADAVLRIKASDVPSQFCLHYSGLAEGPVRPFGFEMGYFVEESGYLSFTDPYLATARTQVLDYFTQQDIADDHVIFRFERTMQCGVGELALMNQLCVQMGFPRRDPGLLAAYIAAENPLVVENYPEMGFFRDIVFLFKVRGSLACLSPEPSQPHHSTPGP